MRACCSTLLLSLAAAPLWAQTPVATDLWRVALGTRAVPTALAEDGTAVLWSPAALLPDSAGWRAGVETVHTPEELGVTGVMAGFAVRADVGTIHFSAGRIGISDLVRTETSPEAVGNGIQAWAQSIGIGVTRSLSPSLGGGVTVRWLSSRLGDAAADRFAVDAGLRLTSLPRTTIAAATYLLDPAFEAGSESGLVAGVEHAAPAFDAWGARTVLTARYGLAIMAGDSRHHLLGAGAAYGNLALDVAAVREARPGSHEWRLLLAIGIRSGRYAVAVRRDGGANGFGATFGFGLTVFDR